MVKQLTAAHQQRLENVICALLEMETRHGRSWSHTQEIGVHFVRVTGQVVDVQPFFLDLALDLLNVPREEEEDSLEEIGERARYREQFPVLVTKGTRAQCLTYAKWVKSEITKTEQTR